MSKYVLKKLINGVGYYTSIELDVKRKNNSKLEVRFLDREMMQKWKPTVESACWYVFEHYRSTDFPGLVVSITYLQTRDVDSSVMTVYFSVVKALLLELKEVRLTTELDERGMFLLPK